MASAARGTLDELAALQQQVHELDLGTDAANPGVLVNDHESAETALADAAKAGRALRRVALRHCALTVLPGSLEQFHTSLVELDLAWNALDRVPYTLTRLPVLRRLVLDGNRVVMFPVSLGYFTALQHLSLAANALKHVPSSLLRLPCLTSLSLRENMLRDLPDSVADAWPLLSSLDVQRNGLEHLPRSLAALTQLCELRLDENPGLTGQDVAACAALVNLRLLSLSGCKGVRGVPDLRRATGLVSLDASECSLTSLPRGIVSLTHLRVLNVSQNQLRHLPRLPGSITSLSAQHNALRALPRPGPPGLRRWNVTGNRLTSLPHDWLVAGRCQCDKNAWNVREAVQAHTLPCKRAPSSAHISLLHHAGNAVLLQHGGVPAQPVLDTLPRDLRDLLLGAVTCECERGCGARKPGTRLFLGPAGEAVRVSFILTLGNFAVRVPRAYQLRPACVAGFSLAGTDGDSEEDEDDDGDED